MGDSSMERQTAVREARGDERLVDVAERAGISPGYLSMIENGLVPQRKSMRERIARAHDKQPADLWGEL